MQNVCTRFLHDRKTLIYNSIRNVPHFPKLGVAGSSPVCRSRLKINELSGAPTTESRIFYA